jgi:hypothetical protein
VTPGLALTLLGLGIGALMIGGSRSDPRASASTLHERVIEAQRISARASQVARDLAAQESER